MATHSATPQENISAVLERFQQWTGDQGRTAAASDNNASIPGFQRSAHQAYASTRQVTRELSYEEALARARSRTRRPWEDEEAAEPAAPSTAAPSQAAATPAPEARAKASTVPAHSKPQKPSKAAAERSTMKTATPPPATRSRTQSTAQNQPRKPAATAAANATHRKTKASGSKKTRTATKATSAKKSEAAAQPSTPPPVPADYDLQTSPSFQQILTAQIKAGPITVPASVTEVVAEPTTVHAEEISGTAVTVTVHLSVTERNALRTRAQQLGLTADAYLRQCALEVESLRSELQELLVTRMQAARQLPAQPRRDWLGRLRQCFFPARADRQTQIFHA
jgi:hypothetical protein